MGEKFPRHAKQPGDGTLEFLGDGVPTDKDRTFEFQVTLGDMDLDDAFRVSLPHSMLRLPMGDLLNRVFPEDETEQTEFVDSLDTQANPDLSEVYDSLLETVEQWRYGYCTLRFFANGGPEIELFRVAANYLSLRKSADTDDQGYAVLDLVWEQTFDVLATIREEGDAENLMEWMRSSALLYLMDKHGVIPSAAPSGESDAVLAGIIEQLRSRNLIAAPPESNDLEISSQGRIFLGEVIAETESYIDHFDVFNDVLYDLDADLVEFGTGSGQDLRVQVYEAESIDVIRAVFLLRLYDGTLDPHVDSWQEAIQDDEFFNDVLRPVLDHDRVDESLLDWIIDGGYSHNEEQAEQAGDQESETDVVRRMRPTE